MNTQFFRDRITQLRLETAVSECQMSLELGHSKGYIQSITSGRVLPTFPSFLEICDYFEITPLEFFDADNDEPLLVREIMKQVRRLNTEDLTMLAGVLQHIAKIRSKPSDYQ